MPPLISLKASGLSTSPNQLETQEGSFKIGSNVIIKRNNVIESRRGYKLYGTQSTSLTKQLAVYKERLLKHFGTTLAFDTQVLNADLESIFANFSGVFNEVDPGLRIKFIESNGNMYFTTAEGIKKISATNGSQFTTAPGYITNAGGVKAINGSARIDLQLGNQTGFLPGDAAVAYRVVWGYNDANKNLILGTPSERIVVYNPLMGLLIPDFDRLLAALDDITTTTTTAFIGDGNYVSTLHLEANATPPALQTQIIALATKLDNDIYYAKAAPVTTEPLTITTVEIATFGLSKQATVTFGVGDANDYFAPGSKISVSGYTTAAQTPLNGNWTVLTVDTGGTFITFNVDPAAAVLAPVASNAAGNIKSYEYRYAISNVTVDEAIFDLNLITVNNPATNNQLRVMQGAIEAIITRLQAEPITVITAPNQTAYISVLDITTTVNVILTINIPQDITPVYFVQLYRSNIAQATGTTLLSDLVPDDEMKLVYEAFPTAAELLARQMIIEDIVLDDFKGANLYTNPATGEGINQANDVPPIAKDINRFKNVLFYANTKTRQRLLSNLLGITNFKAGNITLVTAGAPATITTDMDHQLVVDQIVYINGTGIVTLDGFTHRVATTPTSTTFTVAASGGAGSTTGYWTNAMIAIVTTLGAQQYYFVKGVAEQRTFTAGTKAATNEGALGANYFTINAGNNTISYYVWYKKTGGAVDPAIANSTGIMVDISSAAIVTAADVAERTRNVLSSFPYDFVTTGATTQIIVTNTAAGQAVDSITSTLGVGWSVLTGVQGRGENVAAHEVLLSSVDSPAQALDETSRSLLNVVNLNPTEQVYLYYLSGLADVPGKFLVEGRGLANPQFVMLANNSDVGQSFDPPITPSPDATLSNTLANPSVVSLTAHGLVSGDTAVIAFSNSTPTINGYRLVTFLSANTFSVPVNVTTAGTTGVLTNLTTAVASDNEQKKNRIYYSKINQPEAVPLLNYFDVGSEEKAILRIFPLRDSLFVFKEDGLFRVSGEIAPFNLALFDSSCIMIAADSLGIANNLIYNWTTQGISAVSESGVDILSRNIDIDILKLASSNFPDFKTITWGVGYDSDNSYTVYTNLDPSDTVATIGYRFSNLTNTWTTFDKTQTCGIINSTDDRMYMGAGDVNFIEQERKTFTRLDYADRQLMSSLAANSFANGGAILKLPSTVGVESGDVLYQEQYVTVYNYNNLLLNLDSDGGVGSVAINSITTGTTTPTFTLTNFQFTPADINTGTDTITVANHGFNNNEKVRITSSGTMPAPLTANVDYWIISATLNTFQLATISNGPAINLTTAGTGVHTVFKYHNLVPGDFVIVDGTNSDPVVDGTYEVLTTITGYQFTVTTPVLVSSSNIGTIKLSYLSTLEMSGGQDPRTKLIELAAKLDTDPKTQFSNYFDIIDSKSGTIVSNTAANPTVISILTATFLPGGVNTATDTITTGLAHGLTNGQQVTFVSTGTLPGGLIAGTVYYIQSATAFTFQLSLSAITTPIVITDITSVGAGIHTVQLNHELKTGRYISIAGTNSTPTFNGTYSVTAITPHQFSVPVSIIVSGTSGTYVTDTSNVNDLRASYNAITGNLNLDPGPISTSYLTLIDLVQIEALITSVNHFTNEITLAPAINFIVGQLTIFKAIETIFQYSPQTMGDSLNWKHLTNFTMMFENKAFTEATVSFGTDLLPELLEVPFDGDGNGIFGIGNKFGEGFFGGGSNSAPFRTYFPRQVMRCRYLVIRYRHKIAREQYAIFGVSIDGTIGISYRAYR